MSCHVLLHERDQHDDDAIVHPKHRELDPKELRARRKLRFALGCATTFMVVEIVGGLLAGSLAILTDAAHLLSDVVGFAISLMALYAMQWPTSARLSFGCKRAEVLGALVSVLVIWLLTVLLVYKAVLRFQKFLEPDAKHVVDGKVMFFVACVGLGMNMLLLTMLGHTKDDDSRSSWTNPPPVASESQQPPRLNHHHPHQVVPDHRITLEVDKLATPPAKPLENLNVQAAYVHAVGDLVQSIGVCIAGAVIWYEPGWQIADPIATFLFGLLVLATTSGVIKQSVHVLMEGTPEGIDWQEMESGLNALPAVEGCHDLHIWSLSAGLPSLSVHLTSFRANEALAQAEAFLKRHGIEHTTIQVEDLNSYHGTTPTATPKPTGAEESLTRSLALVARKELQQRRTCSNSKILYVPGVDDVHKNYGTYVA